MGIHKSTLDSWCGSRRGLFINLFFFASALTLIAFPQLVLKQNSVSLSDCFIQEDVKQQRVETLLSQWGKLYFGNASKASSVEDLRIPAAPHIQDCLKQSSIAIVLDSRSKGGKRPEWTKFDWKSKLSSQFSDAGEEYLSTFKAAPVAGPRPPWIKGGDQDNLPMTRQVQTDLWLHQHPKNCSADSVRFLVTDWINSPTLGLGAQIVAMAGIFAVALREKRILVTDNFNRADHEECKGASRGQWSCYFAPETSQECFNRARKLMKQKNARKKRLVHVVDINSFSKNLIWFGEVPEYWGKPWDDMQPLEVVNGELVGKRKAADRQWWRAQAVTYLTRYKSKYLCSLMNKARHQAFGKLAAEAVSELTLPEGAADLETLWTDQSPWKPSPLVSVHVRQGDKAKEMHLFEFSSYMKLADQIQMRFPHVKHIWLSTEMENVIEESRNYTNWRFHYTDVPRQNGTTSMGDYETSLGRITSSNNAFVNLMMASGCDYFVGVLGSTWSFILDGMRATNGKLQAGFLSVNKDRYW